MANFKLNYTGNQINAILARANENGTIDEAIAEALLEAQGKIPLVADSTNGDIPVLDEDGQLQDSGKTLDDLQRVVLTGSGNPSASTGANGDLYVDVSNTPYLLWMKRSGSWSQVGGAGGSGIEYYELTTTTNWTEGDFDFTQEITVTGMLSTDHAKVDVDLSNAESAEDVEAMLTAWGNMYRFETANGKLIVHSSQEADIAVDLLVEVVR